MVFTARGRDGVKAGRRNVLGRKLLLNSLVNRTLIPIITMHITDYDSFQSWCVFPWQFESFPEGQAVRVFHLLSLALQPATEGMKHFGPANSAGKATGKRRGSDVLCVHDVQELPRLRATFDGSNIELG